MVDFTNWRLKHAAHGDKPWAVQTAALRWSNGRPHAGYWLEQGLGKTSLTLNDWVNFAEADGVNMLIVVCPNSFKLDWVQAPAEWGIDGVDARYHPKHIPATDPKQLSLYAINYQMTIQPRGEALLSALLKARKCLLVFDETSNCKHLSSKTAKACIQLAQNCQYSRHLNGTPLTQNVMDYYPQLRMLRELSGMNPFAFRARFAVMGGFMGKQIKGIQNEQILTERYLNKVAFRALKKDWRAELPPQIFSTVNLDMTPTQRKHYREMVDEFGTEIGGREITVNLILTQAAKLQQISSGVLIDGDRYHYLDEWRANSKIKACRDIHNSGMGKTIIVYTYRPCGQMLYDAFTDYGANPAWLRGGMEAGALYETKNKFNSHSECRVLIAQQSAACMGHTLIGDVEGPAGTDRCSRMIYFENSYSLRDRLQMTDRIHRGAQDAPCEYFDLCASPIDAIPIAALQAKKDVADMVDELHTAIQREARRR